MKKNLIKGVIKIIKDTTYVSGQNGRCRRRIYSVMF